MRQKETVASVQIRRHDSVAVHEVLIVITAGEQVHDVYIVHVAISLSQYFKDFLNCVVWCVVWNQRRRQASANPKLLFKNTPITTPSNTATFR